MVTPLKLIYCELAVCTSPFKCSYEMNEFVKCSDLAEASIQQGLAQDAYSR